jgi:hypothetical protein
MLVPRTPGAAFADVETPDAALARSLRSPEDTIVLFAFRSHAIAGPALTEDAGAILTDAQCAITGSVCPMHTVLTKRERLAHHTVIVPTRADDTAAVAALPAYAIAVIAATQYGVGDGATRHHRDAIGAASSDLDIIGAGAQHAWAPVGVLAPHGGVSGR